VTSITNGVFQNDRVLDVNHLAGLIVDHSVDAAQDAAGVPTKRLHFHREGQTTVFATLIQRFGYFLFPFYLDPIPRL
jgi:hypothetical protein